MDWNKLKSVQEKALNEMWDKAQVEALADVRKASPPELAALSIGMMILSRTGKTAHVRNGARNVLFSIMNKMHYELKVKDSGPVSFEDAKASLLDNMENELDDQDAA